MKLNVTELESGPKGFDYVRRPNEFSLGEESVRLNAPLRISGSARRRSDEVRVKAALRGSYQAPCDRCLREVSLPIDLEFEARLRPAAAEEHQSAELSDEDLDYSFFDGETIDVDELAREQILLAAPTRLLCRDECRGLCPECGADLNETGACGCQSATVDPRWEALAALKKRE